MYIENRKYELKYDIVEKEIISIIGIPTLDESKIWSLNGNMFFSKEASEYYGISNLEDLYGKEVVIFRRFKLPNGDYEMPEKYHCQKATFLEGKELHRLDSAYATISVDGKEEDVNLQRVCILI